MRAIGGTFYFFVLYELDGNTDDVPRLVAFLMKV